MMSGIFILGVPPESPFSLKTRRFEMSPAPVNPLTPEDMCLLAPDIFRMGTQQKVSTVKPSLCPPIPKPAQLNK